MGYRSIAFAHEVNFSCYKRYLVLIPGNSQDTEAWIWKYFVFIAMCHAELLWTRIGDTETCCFSTLTPPALQVTVSDHQCLWHNRWQLAEALGKEGWWRLLSVLGVRSWARCWTSYFHVRSFEDCLMQWVTDLAVIDLEFCLHIIPSKIKSLRQKKAPKPQAKKILS